MLLSRIHHHFLCNSELIAIKVKCSRLIFFLVVDNALLVSNLCSNFSILLQFQVAFLVIILIVGIVAPPNPILDNNSDVSVEDEDPYLYQFEQNKPYWLAFPRRTQEMLKKHDYMEINVLRSVRNLDFKLREAWTRHDRPFVEKAKMK